VNSKRGGSYDDQLVESPSWETIASNYPKRVREQLDSLMVVKPETKSNARLILWNGEPGTGKTTAIRSLAREWASWCSMQYISDPEQLFAQSEYLNEVLDEPAREPTGPTFTTASKPNDTWRLLVAEDTDDFLRSDSRRKTNAALARLLNLSDGIFGQNHKIMLLLTTNENVNRLHPALIRPGRCLATVEFERFSTNEARTWLDGKGKTPSRPATLAQLLVRRGDIPNSTDGEDRSPPIGAYL
jgi:SpoVK/Ycf46/Vps4 family AAA+-type ATPase